MKSIVQKQKSLDSIYYKDVDTFFEEIGSLGLTYDDVSLATQYSNILPKDTRLETRLSNELILPLPIISADMDTVTESKMAIAMALSGGMGFIHYNMSRDDQVNEVRCVKNFTHGLIQDPVTVSPDQYIGDILSIIEARKYRFRTFPVVDSKGVLLGLLSGRVVKERYAKKKVLEAMTLRKEVFTISKKSLGRNPVQAADRFFNEHMGIHKLLVVDEKDHLCGLFTMSDIERIAEEAKADMRPARDAHFQLLCGAAVPATRTSNGAIDKKATGDHVSALVDAGVDAVAVSTSHGHSEGVKEIIQLIRSAFKSLTILAGNVTSAEGVAFLAKAGADAIKVGQGPGSICTTRIVAGVGIPQYTALYVTSKEAKKQGVRIIADGGINKSGDIVKALTLADVVMCGGLLAGSREAPGKIMEIEGKLYKEYRGMGSLEAMKAGSAARYGHEKKDTYRKVAAEGIEGLKEASESVRDILIQLSGGIQSGMGYLGAKDLKELKEKARLIQVSRSGQIESAPHDIIEIKTSGKRF